MHVTKPIDSVLTSGDTVVTEGDVRAGVDFSDSPGCDSRVTCLIFVFAVAPPATFNVRQRLSLRTVS